MTLLLLHGALGSRAQLDAVAALVSRRRPVLQVEFEGHGSTPARERPFTVDGLVENVIAALDSAGLDRVDVFGYGLGGYVGLALALASPSRVSTITTLGTRFDWDGSTAQDELARLDLAVVRAQAPEPLRVRTADLVTRLGERPPLSPGNLARIHHRVRIMVGDRDATVSVEESAAAFRRLPSGELMVLPRTPHPIEQVDVYRLADVLIELTS
jgi:pimeloyl-ACP methyl ester carboxylesterase